MTVGFQGSPSPVNGVTKPGRIRTSSEPILRWIIAELRRTAELYKDSGCAVVSKSTVVKSDLESTRLALKYAVSALEEEYNPPDYHPGSCDKVINLVHPSLFPLSTARPVFSPTRFTLPRGKSIPNPYSRKFQWPRCDVDFPGSSGCRIASYINNLHPRRHAGLYTVIEKNSTA